MYFKNHPIQTWTGSKTLSKVDAEEYNNDEAEGRVLRAAHKSFPAGLRG